MKKVVLISCILLTSLMLSAQGISNDAVLNKLQKLEKKIANQQNEIDRLKHTKSTSSMTKEDILKSIDASVEAKLLEKYSYLNDYEPVLQLSSKIKKLKFKGDLRLRYERRERDRAVGNDNRTRYRQRLRLGFTFETKGGWEISLGLATGGTGLGSATSTNDTFSSGGIFETSAINLDYAYAKKKFGNKTLILGKQKNPFKSSWILWDTDLRPAGITGQIKHKNMFVTVGAYDVFSGGTGVNDAILWALQIGSQGKIGDKDKYEAAIAYYQFNDATTDASHTIPTIPNTIDSSYNLSLFDLYLKYSTQMGKTKVSFVGEVVKNFGATGPAGSGQRAGTIKPGNEDLAWMLGVKASQGKFSFGYSYAYIEADSVFGAIKDSDFGGTAGLTSTDLKGNVFSFGYKASKDVKIGLKYFLIDRITGGNDPDSANLLQFDVKYKF